MITVAIYILAWPINDFFYRRFGAELNAAEKNLISAKFIYIHYLGNEEKEEFFKQLAIASKIHLILPLATVKLYEELKWMVIGPAIRLRIFEYPEILKKYQRTAVYPHPFITPEMEFVHIGEHNRLDGVLIFAAEQLYACYEDPNRYLNAVLYEWCLITVEEGITNEMELHLDEMEPLSQAIFNQRFDLLLDWLGIKYCSLSAMTLLFCITNPEAVHRVNPKIYQFYLRQIQFKSVKVLHNG